LIIVVTCISILRCHDRQATDEEGSAGRFGTARQRAISL
jgi:hypothetical protein